MSNDKTQPVPFADKQRELIEYRKANEARLLQLDQLPLPPSLRTAKERAAVEQSRQHVVHCLRLLGKYPEHFTYTRNARIVLQQEHENLSQLLAQFDEIPAPESSRTVNLRDALESVPQIFISERRRQKISQENLAQKVGISRSRLNEWERSLFAGVPLSRLRQIAEELLEESD